MSPSLFSLLVLAALLTISLAAPAKKHSSLLTAQHVRTPTHLAKKLSTSKLHSSLPTKASLVAMRPQGRHTIHTEGISSSGQSVTLPVEDWWQWYLIANITAGIPAQQMRVAIDLHSPDLQLIAANATLVQYTCSDDQYCPEDYYSSEQTLDDKQEYNASASSTSRVTNGNFTSWRGNSGVIVSDIINLHGLVSNMTFGSLSTIQDWNLQGMPADGYLGIAPFSSANNIPTVLTQLAPSLDKPLISLRISRDIDDWQGNNTIAQISFGSSQLQSTCASDDLQMGLNPAKQNDMPPTFNASSFAIVNANLSDPCTTNSLPSAHPVMILDYFMPIICSTQLEQLFVAASGAKFNQTSGWYQVDCSAMGSASPVSVSLADGNEMLLQPSDYIVQSQGQCYLYTWGYYDENDDYYADWSITLGQQWLNNHFLTYNIQQNTLTIRDAN